MKKRFFAALLSFIMIFSLLPMNVLAASNSTVVLHPAVGSTVTGVKVKVGDNISGYKVSSISGYDITVDLGKYNVNNGTFRLPYAKDIWEGVDNNKVDYISWAGSGSNSRSEGASALLANGKNTAYYYFKGDTSSKYTFVLKYDANGGTGAPADQSWSTKGNNISHTFNISSTTPTREGYVFKGWQAEDGSSTIYHSDGTKGVTTCAVSKYGNDVVKNGNTWTRTLYAVWEKEAPPTPDKPTAPGEEDLSKLIGNITVNCTNDKATHDPKSNNYALIKNSYTTSEVEGDAESGYTYTVTINSRKYVEQFDTDTGAAHDPKSGTATVTLEYENDAWSVKNGTPVVFNVACKTEIVPPAKPGAEDLAKLEAPVEVVCTAKPETHTAAPFALIEGTYTVGDVTGNETDGYT